MHRPPPPQHTRPGSKGGKGGRGGRSGSGGRGGSGVGFHRPTHVPQNPSFPFNGSLQSHVNLPNPPPNPFQSSTFAQASHPFLHNLVFPHTNPTSDRHAAIQRIEAVAVKARRELIAAGQSVSSWKVSQAALLALKIDAWSSLGFQIQDVPSLHNLIVTEGKINAFIHCFVGSQRITSLYELEVAICKNEGVERFEELSLGPILRQPLIEHYFSVSSNVTNIFKITTEEIICILRTFMEKHKRIVLEEFLDFVAEKKSSSREMLCVRIQSLGLHISYIRQANKEEKASLRKCFGQSKKRPVPANKVSQDGKEESSQPPNILFQKRALEGRFGLLSNRVKTFASECDDSSVKHIRFDSSESDDDCNDDNCHADNHVEKDCRYMCQNQSSYNRDNGKHASSCPYPSTDNGKHASSCPYPSTAEEMVRLGLKVETSEKSYCDSDKTMKSGSKNSSGKKRRFKEENFQSSCKFLKKNATKLKGKELDDLSLTNVEIENVEIEKFITTWKEACREHSFMEVLDMMVNFYTDTGTLKQKRRKKRILLSYPAIGLMNIAIMTIKHGVVDSLYDTFQAFGESEFSNPRSAFSVEMIDVGPVSKENTASNAVESTGAKRISIAIDDIIKKITDYLDVENFVNRERILHSGKILWLLKKLQDCEGWLLPQFSVKKFSSLGYGNFLEFLERYGSSLPHELQQIFIEGLLDPSSKYVALSEQQLSVLLSLADYNWSEGFKTKNDALMLLKKQFPTISFNIIGDDLEKCFLNLIKCQKDNDGQGCVLFSAALLGKQWTRMDHYGKYSSQTAVLTNPQICSSATSTFENAIDCLLAAPMLSDLFSWSHWDIVYAPSFGPLIDWLLNEVPTKELLCIATKDGKLIKVDSSTTVDEFLRALIQLSPFHAALKLLSLVSLYRGTSHAPVALLKSYAEQAMSVIIRNFLDSGELKMARKNSIGSPQELAVSDEEHNLDPCSIDLLGISLFRHENGLGKSFSKVNKASSVVARLILDCLSLLPSEFWTFVADILVSSLRSFTREAPSIILSECNKPEERLMLHNIGISLGLEEWIQDYHVFSSTVLMNRKKSQSIPYSLCSQSGRDGKHIDLSVELKNVALTNDTPSNKQDKSFSEVKQKEFKLHHGCHKGFDSNPDKEIINGALHENSSMPDSKKIQDSNVVIEAIRREEFGLDQNYSDNESRLLTKQHARLGRALHCLSQELYSQDSHLLLELVQNADDNVYDHTVEPTLVFILQEAGIIVLNNEVGFSADNIRALCDIGNSTKKGSSAGYIGHKGIGFKSVFRVTDAPEIHSNGFHVKFDITEDQIGFVLPTVISPCDMDMFKQLLSGEDLEDNHTSWNTCIILPFRSKLVKETTMSSIISMFSDLHPSLLLFLHKLRCIRLENMLNDTSLVLRRETRDDGIVKVSHGNQMMSWLVVSKRLQANVIRQGVETTEIAVAFTLQESERGEYRPFLSQQPAFAFLPLRNYGLKFIVQGDFILPSSREEVDGDSAWNQWLLSEFPALFVNAEQSFCSLSCYQENPGKAVTAYLSFVPLVGEVHGFFSHLPHMIISKLRMSNCLLLDGPSNDWVLPCRTLRSWNEQARLTLPDCLLQKHLGLVYLNKDIIISDALAKALGVHDYGPKLLIDFVSSLCRSSDGIKSLGLDWLSSWFVVLHSSFASPSYLNSSINHRMEFELINALRNIPLIPLSDGSYGSISDGPIWLPCDVCSVGLDRQQYQNLFPILYSKLRIVNPLLFSTSRMTADNLVDKKVEYLIQTLLKIGVQQLSAHEVIKSHILAALSDDEELKNDEDSNWMIEYLAFIMVHLQFPCSSCHLEKDEIINKLRKSSILLTNQGFRCPENEPIHFPKEYGNPVDIDKLIGTLDLQWLEVDIGYLKHPSCHSLSSVQHIWREFLKELGVTDFVLIKSVRKHAADVLLSGGTICDEELILATTFINDWESTELDRILSTLSLNKCRDKCVYLLEILDKMWDQCYSSKAISFFFSEFSEYKKPVRSSFMKNICKIGWIASSMDLELHEATDLFHDCKEVRSLLGDMAPYAVPQLNSKLLLKEIGFKTEISHDDAFSIFNCWRMSKAPFLASVNQMSKLYSFISDGVATAKVNMTKEFMSSYFIFVPFITTQMSNNVGAGTFLSPKDLFWHDPTGCFDKIKEVLQSIQRESSNSLPCKVLSSVYPNLHDFFVKVCHVHEVPPFKSYLQILLQLSSVALPSQAANAVFLRWSDDIKTGVVNFDEILDMKNNLQKLESRVLPTVLDKWVSLHPSFGLICWADDEDLKRQFVHLNEVDFLHLGEINNEEKELLSEKIAMLMRKLGVPVLSEVVSREAIFYGTGDDRDMASLINWVLPYAQRYIYKLYPDKYSNLKQFGFVKLNQLQIIVVEKLFYKFSIRGCGSASNKRFECSCLLQENILYVAHPSDSHCIFLELSRFFFDGPADLHLANFLHMITTMAESGSSVEQIEFFIVNSQKVPILSDEEPVWCLSFLMDEYAPDNVQATIPASDVDQNASRGQRKTSIFPSWPPTDWKTAPDFSYCRNYSVPSKPGLNLYSSSTTQSCSSLGAKKLEVIPDPIEVDGDWVVEEGLTSKDTLVLQESGIVEEQPHLVETFDAPNNQDNPGPDNKIELADPSVLKTLSTSLERDNIYLHIYDDHQSRTTGRIGEIITYKYLTRRLGLNMVKWVNEQTESGLPYDMIIGNHEYVEVKATRYANKNWFEISAREWQSAVELGDSFSIAHVVLSGQKKASITMWKNPLRLCHQNALRLALFMPRQTRDFSDTG